MASKNKIKINSFVIEKMEQTDANEALRLFVKAQSILGVSETESFSLFLLQNKNLILENISYSYVYKNDQSQVFGVIIIRPETNISAEIFVIIDPNVIAGHKMYNEFKNVILSLKYKYIFLTAFKRRKNFQKYLNFCKFFGFSEILNENDVSITLGFKKY